MFSEALCAAPTNYWQAEGELMYRVVWTFDSWLKRGCCDGAQLLISAIWANSWAPVRTEPSLQMPSWGLDIRRNFQSWKALAYFRRDRRRNGWPFGYREAVVKEEDVKHGWKGTFQDVGGWGREEGGGVEDVCQKTRQIHQRRHTLKAEKNVLIAGKWLHWELSHITQIIEPSPGYSLSFTHEAYVLVDAL